MRARDKKLTVTTARKMRILREENDLTKIQMAHKLGILAKSYRLYENGETIPGINTLTAVIEHFGVAMDWLIFDRGPKYIEDKASTDALQKEIDRLKTVMANDRQTFEDTLRKKDEKIEELEKTLEKIAAVNIDILTQTGITELLKLIEENPVFYYKLMLYVEEYKTETKGKTKTGG